MNGIGLILILLALAEITLGFWFVVRYRRQQATVWYGLFMIGVGLYVGANGLGYLDVLLTQGQAEHLAWTGGALVATFILPFSYTFPLQRKTVRELLPLALWPLAIFVPGILWTNAFILQQATVNFGNGYTTQPGPYFPFFIAFFGLYWLGALVNLTRSYRNADGIHRQQVGIFLLGTVLSVVISSYFDIFKPLTNATQYGYVGSLCSSIWFGFTAYILVKK